MIIFLFIKNLYNKDTRWWIAVAKTINTLAVTFKFAHQSLLKLKKYERLIYNDECNVAKINQMIDTPKDTNQSNSIKPSSKGIINNKITLTGVLVGSVMNLAT